MRAYQLVSADSHLEVSPTVWSSRLPEHLRDKGPRVVTLEGGGEGWAIGDTVPVPLGLAVTGGLKYSEFQLRGKMYSHNPSGAGDPTQRIAEQDQDGTDGEILFCSPIAAVMKRLDTVELQVAACRAYNDWLSDYCSEAPDRLFGIALMPFTGVEDAIAELRRVVGKKGVRAIQLLKFPSGGEFLTPEDDPFWAAIEELGVCVVAHHNFGGDVQADPLRAPMTSSLVMSGSQEFKMLATLMTCDMTLPTIPIVTILQLMLSGTLDRFPGLRFHIAESLIGWLPYWLEQMEDRYDRHRFWSNVDLPRRPVQYVRDHFTFSFMEDHVGVAMRHQIGLDNICWASDFPHSVSDWPWSLETVQREFKDVPADERLKMQALNVLRQLRIVNESEYDQLVRQPLDDRFPDSVPARGARRL